MVNGPTRPMNIMMVIRILPQGLKSPVNPALSPTVPNADTVSNTRRCISVPCSVSVSKKKITKINNIPDTAMDKDLNTSELGILRLKILISSLLVTTAHSVKINTAKVVTDVILRFQDFSFSEKKTYRSPCIVMKFIISYSFIFSQSVAA